MRKFFVFIVVLAIALAGIATPAAQADKEWQPFWVKVTPEVVAPWQNVVVTAVISANTPFDLVVWVGGLGWSGIAVPQQPQVGQFERQGCDQLGCVYRWFGDHGPAEFEILTTANGRVGGPYRFAEVRFGSMTNYAEICIVVPPTPTPTSTPTPTPRAIFVPLVTR